MNRASILVCVWSLIAIAALSTPAHASLSSPDWNEPVTLKLAGGRKIEGRYRGMPGSIAAADYPGRYDAWRSSLGLAAVPALGESILVLSIPGRPERGVCRGFVNDALLLGGTDSVADHVLPLSAIAAVMRIDASAPDSSWTGVGQLWKRAPSLCVVTMQVGDATLAVPPTMVKATVRKDDPGGALIGGLLLGVLVGVIVGGSMVASEFAHAHI